MTDRFPPRIVFTLALVLAGFAGLTSCNARDVEEAATSSTSQPVSASTAPVDENPDLPTDYEPVRYFNDEAMFSLEPPMNWEVDEPGDGFALSSMVDPVDGARILVTIPGPSIDPANALDEILAVWLGEDAIGETTFEDSFETDAGPSGGFRAGRLRPGSESGIEGWAVARVETSAAAYMFLSTYPEEDSVSFLAAFLSTLKSFRLEPGMPRDFPRENALVLAGSEPLTLDPALTHFGGSGMIGDIFSGLVVLDPQMKVKPALAQGWDVNEDGTVYTFHLNPRARFHNGRPVTADDVLFSWERAARPETNSETVSLYMGDIVGLLDFHAGEADSIEGVRVIDAHTLEVRVDGPKPYFLAKLTYPVSWVVDRYQVGFPNWANHPNGTGPFRHVQHLEETFFLLERNPFYSAEAPHLDFVAYLIYAGYTQSLYQTGEVDFTGLTRDQLERAEDPRDGFYGTVISETGLCTSYVTFNTSLPPFDDPLVRKAFVLAVDRERYVEALTNGEAVVGRGLLPPGMPGVSEDVRPPIYDPELARDYLAESDYYAPGTEPPEIIWTLGSSSGYYSSAAAFLVDTWKDVLDVDIQVEGIDWLSYYDQVDAGNYGHLLLEGWCADYPDPENFLDVLFHSASSQNHAYYNDPEYDGLIEAARTAQNPELRLELYRQSEQYLLDAAPILVLSHSSPSYGVWKAYVFGYVPSPIDVPQNYMIWIER
ncbi:MAG: peptide ABC transporter substrate-binding protein [Anaerolineales bacterium]